MVKGLELFREQFKEYSGQYMLIGGTACTILIEEAGMEFRLTKERMVLLLLRQIT